MSKYLYHGSYTLEGLKGLLKEGGSSRRSHFDGNVRNLGGQVEAFYFAFGGEDVYAIVDLPDNASAAALSLAIGAGAGFRGSMIVLLAPGDVDDGIKRAAQVGYRPPGQAR